MPDAAPHWSWSVDADGIGWLGADREGHSTNTLGHEVLAALDARLADIERTRPRAVVVWSAKPNGFIAGADVGEFAALTTPDAAYALIRQGQGVIDRLAALPCPTVAAIHGFALGGGLELALACRYRVAADAPSLTLGLPEVQLGIHPGFGGTVRAPRLIGARAALELMLTGRPMRGARALAVGLVDRLVPAERLKEAAAALAREAPAPRRAPWLDRLLTLAPLRALLARRAAADVARRAPRDHYPAPYAIVELWRLHGATGAAAFEAEARSVAALFCTEASRNLVRMFLLQDRLKGFGDGDTPTPRHVHVVGAGVMGGDIATWCAQRGLTVSLQDRSAALIEPALARARAVFAKRPPAEAAAALARLTADVDGRGVGAADIVIEAIVEDAGAKQALYATLEPRLKPHAVLATNTSSLVVEDLAVGLAEPARLVGLHFFNPVAQMPLVEVVQGRESAPDAVASALAFARRIGKLPLPCLSAPGFVVNRVLFPYLTEAMLLAAEGVPLAAIDAAAVAFGMPLGPVELADTVGLDVALHVGRVLAAAYGSPPPAALEPLVAAGHLGRKTGQGLYAWRDGKPLKTPLGAAAVPADLLDRLILPLVNAAVGCLREGIVADEALLDAGVVFGTGFAPFRGGPLRYARNRGTGVVIERLRQLASAHGPRFVPDEGWRTVVD